MWITILFLGMPGDENFMFYFVALAHDHAAYVWSGNPAPSKWICKKIGEELWVNVDNFRDRREP